MGEDYSLLNFFWCLLVGGMLSGIIPGVLLVLVCCSVDEGVKSAKKIAATDYSKISAEEKQDLMSEELKRTYKKFS